MRKTLTVLVLLLIATTAQAGEDELVDYTADIVVTTSGSLTMPHAYGNAFISEPITITMAEIGISACEGIEECVQLETRSGKILRVYTCGKVEELVWKELSKNEEPQPSLGHFYLNTAPAVVNTAENRQW